MNKAPPADSENKPPASDRQDARTGGATRPWAGSRFGFGVGVIVWGTPAVLLKLSSNGGATATVSTLALLTIGLLAPVLGLVFVIAKKTRPFGQGLLLASSIALCLVSAICGM